VSDRYALSRRQHERARESLAGGVATAFRAGQLPLPITFVRGEGPRIYDLDGNAYVDYGLGFGPLLLGHSPAVVLDAVRDQLGTGLGYGASHPLEAELAETVCRLVPSAELCIFGSTGSEAVHVAIRIARAATGRMRVVKFLGHYHGWLDPIYLGTPGQAAAGPGTAGQDPQAAGSVTVIEWNDLPALERELSGGDVATVIMEPLNVNGGCLEAAPGYLEDVRELTRRRSVVLIFDEVITGFRLALGGAQEHYGVTPDLTVLGKALGAGFPISAVCGSCAVMDTVASGTVAHVGTFNANPVCAAAALAALSELERQRDEIYPRLASRARRLAELMTEASEGSSTPLQVNHNVGVAHAFASSRPVLEYADSLAADGEGYRQLTERFLDNGVHVIPRGLLYVSSEHTEAELEETGEALARALGASVVA
jgi:glutamate-1-semialdehyde 2,1-aminomutase